MASKQPGWGERFKRWLIGILRAVGEPDPAGGVVPERGLTIDDGVDYRQPLVVPGWLTPEQKADYVAAVVKEASADYHFPFDRPYLNRENLSQYPTADPLREWDFNTRREVLARCHLAYERNPLANTAVSLTTLFSMGEGLTVTYRNQDVEALIEAFRANPENAVEINEKAFCTDLQVDGELFIRFHKDNEGQTVITTIPPWEIDWIETERGFIRRVTGYHRANALEGTGKPGDVDVTPEELIPADEVLHVTLNRHSYELRGRSELFRLLPWLKAYKDWLEGRARQNHWRGSILYDVTVTGANPQQVANKRAQYKQPPPPGSLVIHNEKEAWEVKEAKVGAADVAEDGRQIKLMTAAGKKLPEYMLGDGENANLASSQSQQLPALKAFVEFQDVNVHQLWTPIYRRVIENAIAAGTLTEMVPAQHPDGEAVKDDGGKGETIKAIDAFELSGPELEGTDPKTLAEALQIAVTNNWASNETASGEMGYDYRAEQKKIDAELMRERERMAQGLRPGPAMADLAGFEIEDDGETPSEPARHSGSNVTQDSKQAN